MDVSDKKTVLDDSAAIYHPHEERSERETWKELKGFSAKWTHFKSYYLRNSLLVLAVLALLGYIVYTFVRPKKEEMLFVAIVDGVVGSVATEELQKEYQEYFGLDEETQMMVFDNTMMLSAKGDANSSQRFTAYLFAQELDVIIATESCFREIAGGCCFPLAEMLPEDIYAQQKERFCLASKQDDYGNEIEGSEQPYGLYVTDLLSISPYCKEPVVFAICGNSQRKENAEAFLRFLLQKENN